MKLLTKYLILISLLLTTLNAQSTMCYKENHSSISTVESVKLDGGVCQGQKSVEDMKKEGWINSDIKIQASNYIYIFKKDEINMANVDMDLLEKKIVEKLEKKKEEKLKVAKEKLRIGKISSGKKIYLNKCQTCHGKNGQILVSNTSRDISSFSIQQFKETLTGYRNDDKDYYRGREAEMKAFAMSVNSNDINNIFVYLKSLKNKKENPIKVDKK